MLSRITTFARDHEGLPIQGRIEADVRPGLPGLTIIGTTGGLAADRGDVRAEKAAVFQVLEALNVPIPRRRLVVHAVPARAPMPAVLYVPVIAAALIAASGWIDPAPLEQFAAVPRALDLVGLEAFVDRALVYDHTAPISAIESLLTLAGQTA